MSVAAIATMCSYIFEEMHISYNQAASSEAEYEANVEVPKTAFPEMAT